MKKILIFALMSLAVLWSCDTSTASTINEDNKVKDTTLCQFSHIKQHKMYSYCDDDGDTLYFDNKFTALWPEVINGKPCDALQQALFRSMTDSLELNRLDIVTDFLLNPANYTEYDSDRFVPVETIKPTEGKLSSSEVNVIMENINDRLLIYRLSTYIYTAGAAHGIYANNYVTYDLQKDKAVALRDLIADTTLLRSTIFRSIKNEYDYDKDQLFIPDNGLLPLPRDFYIQDEVLHVVYQVYEIASYAQGMIDAPIYPFLLKPEEMKRLLTPYGRELLVHDD